MAQLTGDVLNPARLAAARTFIRRASLDLTGLPPSPAEVHPFLTLWRALPFVLRTAGLLPMAHAARTSADGARDGESHLDPPLRHGIVASLDNFAKSGAEPTHPELLDWLATEFAQQGWGLKKLHKLIVMSAAYRQSADSRPDGLELQRKTE